MSSIKITYFGTATVLIEIGGTRILTDPVFGPKGISATVLGIPCTTYFKLEDSKIKIEDILPIDYILLSHDQHIDNLDNEGRKFFPNVKRIFTTLAAAQRIGANSIGLSDFQSTSLKLANGDNLEITATPCRHGPPLSLPIVGSVIGFLLDWKGHSNGPLYISGDTVLFKGINEIGNRFKIDTALIHFGSAKTKATQCIHYTFSAQEGVKVAKLLNLKRVIPLHYDGWSHFSESKENIITCFREQGMEEKLLWLHPNQVQLVSLTP